MNTVLIGAQWGDEGKGKIIDVLGETHELVVRSQGGNNAGHTVFIGGEKFVLHLVPTGMLRPDMECLIGHGTVVDPVSLVGEIRMLEGRGVKVKGRLHLADRAHLVMPYHRALDAAREKKARGKKIGTTGRGIGPTYYDKIARTGIRVHELLDGTRFAARVRDRVKEANVLLKSLGAPPVSAAAIIKEYGAAANVLRPYITDGVRLIHDRVRTGARILFEGAQGTFLDIDYGTYPYVTSSNTTAGGACTGGGLPPRKVDRVMGVIKAYTTRVGEGPLPTVAPELGDLLHGLGREFGATTGRARRCGWFDAVLTRYAAMVNGIDSLAVTNLDGLDTMKQIKICTGYQLGGKTLDLPPACSDDFARCRPVYKTMPGWNRPTSACRSFDSLPPRARAYLKEITRLTGGTLEIVSVGAKREETFFL